MPNRIKRKQAIDFIISLIRTSNELCVDKCRYFWREPIRCELFGTDLKLTKYQDAYRCEHCLSLVGNEQNYGSTEDENKLNYKNRKA